ncbi:hypothetical protein E8E13_009876 [Curvularia kusanoi]|uniref:NACHT domain-containing protein n=1 Tax=Curvularia kusanoi TaxID=90978 RepID=A0A9P4TE90_CURKU|nr:hypothetical protein E8E13_009876 [Curvularia kusanoi]
MRLLHYDDEGHLALTDDLVDESSLPAYAILSHTWIEGEELTFQELKAGAGTAKSGHRKIEYCGQQAQRDSLKYFWVDTCCIDKTNIVEYRHAIKSMFRWCQAASICYVYLADVSSRKRKGENDSLQNSWQRAFAESRWFTRGWTLQELLAPEVVEFYSSDWTKLGDKVSLQVEIHHVTAVPLAAVNGALLSEFSVEERLEWGLSRKTTFEEDRVYCMEGFFGIDLAPIYGIGYQEAFKRLQDGIKMTSACLRDLHVTDSRDDKCRIEETKGGLLKDSSQWLFDTREYQHWLGTNGGSVLWIKGDPGKGKTMLICSIADDLHTRKRSTDVLAYFFCQATDSRINNAQAVLRGLLSSICEQQPLLASHLRKQYDRAGAKMFEGSNALTTLINVFNDILKDTLLPRTYVLIDALDECDTNLKKLLRFISRASGLSSRVRWAVSSRNWPLIEDELAHTEGKSTLSLELNSKSIAAAVRSFIRCKVNRLAAKHDYDIQNQKTIFDYVSLHAQDTFLWVALLFNTLETVPKRHVISKLRDMPAGLDALYSRMLSQIPEIDAPLCLQVMAIVAKVFRPVTTHELGILLTADPILQAEELSQVISLCGFRFSQFHPHELDSDPLLGLYYSCEHWLSHLLELDFEVDCDLLAEGWIVDEFWKSKWLYWLELVSIHDGMLNASRSLTRLADRIKARRDLPWLNSSIQDAKRFVGYHHEAISKGPLQIYASALFFSPSQSFTRNVFAKDLPPWVTTMNGTTLTSQWPSSIFVLGNHWEYIRSVVFSRDMSMLLSTCSRITTVWDTSTGLALDVHKGDKFISSVFLFNSRSIAVLLENCSIQVFGDRQR